jgi:hypothetical protein
MAPVRAPATLRLALPIRLDDNRDGLSFALCADTQPSPPGSAKVLPAPFFGAGIGDGGTVLANDLKMWVSFLFGACAATL